MRSNRQEYIYSMKNTILLVMVLSTLTVSAQTIKKYYTYDWKETTIAYARFLSIIEKEDSVWHRRDIYLREKKLQMDGYFIDSTSKIKEGKFYYFHSNGKLSSAGRYSDNKRTGIWRQYHSNGRLSDSTVYIKGNPAGISLSWYPDGRLSDSAVYQMDGSGFYINWFADGTVSATGSYSKGKKNGSWKYYHTNGKLSAREEHDHGELISVSYFTETNEPDDTIDVNKPAVFPGGEKAWKKHVRKHLQFPDDYKIDNADRAVVIINATIDADGNISAVDVNTPFHPDFDKAAIQIFKKSPKWIPATEHNRRVQYTIRQTITFFDME